MKKDLGLVSVCWYDLIVTGHEQRANIPNAPSDVLRELQSQCEAELRERDRLVRVLGDHTKKGDSDNV